jgi:hypothetical protein
MKRVGACVGFVAVFLIAGAAFPQSEVSERAFEEVMPGVFVRGGSSVVIDLGDQRCHPPCAERLECLPACRETACVASAGPRARCNECSWQCE